MVGKKILKKTWDNIEIILITLSMLLAMFTAGLILGVYVSSNTIEELSNDNIVKERILINKLKDWAKEHQGDWTPNWKDFDEEKDSVIYDNEHENFKTIENYYYQEIIKLPYFKSEEIAKQFIEEFGDEIKEVLC